MKGMNLSKFKKVSSDKHVTTLRHPDGHEFRVSHKALTPKLRTQLDAIPLADGGDVSDKKAPPETDRTTHFTPEETAERTTPLNYDPSMEQVDPREEEYVRRKYKAVKKYAEGDEVRPEETMSQPPAQPQQAPVVVNVNSGPAQPQPEPAQPQGGWLQNADMAKLATPPLPDGPPPAPHSDWSKVAPPPDDGTPKRGLFSPDIPSGAPSAQGAPPPAAAPAASAPGLAAEGQLPNVTAGDVYKTGMAGIAAGQEADQTLAKERFAATQAHIKAAEEHAAKFAQGVAAKQTEIENATKDVQNGEINPNHFLESKSTVGKVSTAIGLILGGIGAGMTHGENQALKFLNAQIDRDIESQKMELGKRHTILSAYQKQYDNMHVAESMARATELSIYAAHLDAAAAKAADPKARERALMAATSLKAQIMPMVQQTQIREMLSGAQKGGTSTADPAQFVRHLVPEKHQEAVFKEIKRAQDVRAIAPKILEAFDRAVKDNTTFKRAGGLRGDPGSVKELGGLLLTTVGDLEGSVKQAAMDSVTHNYIPGRGLSSGSESDIADMRRGLEKYLGVKSSAPTAKGFGIDLDHFASTKPVTQSEGKPAPAEGVTGTYKGKPVVFRGGKWQPR